MTEDTNVYDSGSERVNVDQSALKSLNAASAQVDRSAIQRLTADTVYASRSAFGITNAATVEVREGALGVAAGDYVKIEESSVFLLLAPRVSGNVKALITLPAAFAFGAGFFLARWLLIAAFGRESKSK